MCLKIINVNPSKRKTEDAFVRAVCLALNIQYKQAYRAIADYSLGACLSMNDARAIKGFMKSLGYNEQRLINNCNVEDFIDNYAEKGRIYVLKIGRSTTTVVKNKIAYDSYDVGKKSVNSYWKIN